MQKHSLSKLQIKQQPIETLLKPINLHNKNNKNIPQQNLKSQRTTRPGHHKRSSSLLKSLDFLSNIKDKSKQDHAIKAFNYVNNNSYKPLVDQPEIVYYILQTIKQCHNDYNIYNKKVSKQQNIKNFKQSTNNDHMVQKNINEQLNRHNQDDISNFNSQKFNIQQLHSRYNKFDPDRHDLSKLNQWLTQKMKQHKNSQKKPGTIIIQRIHALHLAFSQACRQAGKYSHQISQILSNVHYQYHSMYENLVNCLMKQNLCLKKKISEFQQNLNKVINHYEKQLLDIRHELDKKSAKILQNFHTCIAVKQQLEQENKRLNNKLKSQKLMLNFVEEGLAKAIEIILQIGENKFKFLSAQQEKKILQINSDYKEIPDNYGIFHKWCRTVVRMIGNLKQKENGKTKYKKQRIQNNFQRHVQKFTFKTISQFMADFDSSLSIRDAQNILLDFLTIISKPSLKQSNLIQRKDERKDERNNQAQMDIKMATGFAQINNLTSQQIQKYKNKNKYEQKHFPNPIMPNLYQIAQKFKGVNAQIQTSGILDSISKSIQTTSIESNQIGILVKPKTLNKQVETSIKQKLCICRVADMDMYLWAQKQLIQHQHYKLNQNSIKLAKQQKKKQISFMPTNQFIQKQTINMQKQKKSAITEIQTKPDPKITIQQKQNIKKITKKVIKHQLQSITQKQQQINKDNQIKNNLIPETKNTKLKNIKRQNTFTKKVTFGTKDMISKKQAIQQNAYDDTKIVKSIQSKKELTNNNKQNVLQNMSIKSRKSIDRESILNQTKVKRQRIQSKSKTVFVKNIQIFQFDGLDNKLQKYNRSKSVKHIRDFNQARQFNKQIDIDLKVQNILTKRKQRIRRDQDQSDGYQQNQLQIQRHLISRNLKNDHTLDIYGHHLTTLSSLKNGKIFTPPIGNSQHSIVNLIKNSRFNNQLKRKYFDKTIKFEGHTHSFFLQFINILQQKNRKITQSTMWDYKKNVQIQKLVKKLHLSRQRIMPTTINLSNTIQFVNQYIDPIIKAYLAMFVRLIQFQEKMAGNQFKINLLSGKRISYYHRLAPVMHIIINLMSLNCFGVGKCTKYATNVYKGIKNLKKFDKKLQLYDQLIQGETVQLDVLVKIIYYLSQNRSIILQNQYVQLSVIELQLFFILELYLTPGEINNFISQLRNMKKEDQKTNITKNEVQNYNIQSKQHDKINLNTLVIKTLKYLAQKKANLMKKYKSLLQILSGNTNQPIIYSDLVLFIETFPADKKSRYKILFNSSFYLIYWSKKQAVIPTDRLLFLLDTTKFISNEALQKNLIVEYFKMKCQKQYIRIYDKILQNPDHILESVYKLLYKVPAIIYRLSKQLRSNKNSKNPASILAVLYHNLIQDELQRVFFSGYLNAISAIPIPI